MSRAYPIGLTAKNIQVFNLTFSPMLILWVSQHTPKEAGLRGHY